MFKFNILLILLVILVFINKHYFYLHIEGGLDFKVHPGPQKSQDRHCEDGCNCNYLFYTVPRTKTLNHLRSEMYS
jgi:uncharacterized membrane protein